MALGGAHLVNQTWKNEHPIHRSASPTFDVRDFGAIGDGLADDTLAIQAAINRAVNSNGGTVYLPSGVYIVQPQKPRQAAVHDVVDDGHALTIHGSGVRLLGAGSNKSVVKFRAYGGDDPSRSWQIVGGYVWRGAGIFITGGSTADDARGDVVIERLGLDGGAEYTGNSVLPANPATGDGWDVTHKAIWLQNDKYHRNFRVQDCEAHHFRGEIIYGGGLGIGNVIGRRNTLHHTNADAWSFTARTLFEENEVHTCAHAGVEDTYLEGESIYRNNTITGTKEGITLLATASFTGDGKNLGPVTIEGNDISLSSHRAILLQSPWNMTVKNNVITDSAFVNTSSRAIQVDTSGGLQAGSPSGITVSRNKIFANGRDVRTGIEFVESTRRFRNVLVEGNRCELTKAGRASGVRFETPYVFDGLADPKRIRANTAIGTTYNRTDERIVTDFLLTSTSTQTLVRYRPSQPQDLAVTVRYRIIAEETDIRIVLQYYDGDGKKIARNIVDETAQRPGSYTAGLKTIHAIGEDETQYVEVSAIAGMKDRIFVSANIAER